MKSLIALPFLLMFFTLTSTSVFAAESSPRFTLLFDDELNLPYVLKNESGEKVYCAFEIDSEGNRVDIPLEEYIRLQESSLTVEDEIQETLNSIDITPRSPDYFVKLRYAGQDGSSKINGARQKVTADIKGPGSVSVGESITVSESFSGTYGVALGEEIKYNASFNWVKSLLSAKTFGVTLNVAAGKTGYVGFTPYINKTWGKAYIDTYNMVNQLIKSEYSGIVYGYSPKKTSAGYCDGLYELVYK